MECDAKSPPVAARSFSSNELDAQMPIYQSESLSKHGLFLLHDEATDPDTAPVLFVTGFGPFLHHAVNPSNVAVAALLLQARAPKSCAVLVHPLVEVAYDAVQQVIE